MSSVYHVLCYVFVINVMTNSPLDTAVQYGLRIDRSKSDYSRHKGGVISVESAPYIVGQLAGLIALHHDAVGRTVSELGPHSFAAHPYLSTRIKQFRRRPL